MAPEVLKPFHHRGQANGAYFGALIQLADLVVLAEDAGKVAAGEEDGAGAVHAHQGRLLAEVRSVAVDPGVPFSTAEAQLVLQAVDAAMSGADLAGFKPGDGLAGTILQFTLGHPVVAGHGTGESQVSLYCSCWNPVVMLF